MHEDDCKALNPYGLRIIGMNNGVQLKAPLLKYIPLLMQYDLLSQSLVQVVPGSPREMPPETETGKPVVALVGMDENSGDVVLNDPADFEGGVPVVQFCKATNPSCQFKPVGHILPYDYNSVAFGTVAFDSFDQTIYMILYSSDVGPASYTLFGI